ncbi:hypothetical protein ACFXJP_13210, partial [Streptomyces mirabilis]
MTDFDVLRVFCGPGGEHGNELGVVREGSVMPDPEERQAFAAKLGFSETVFGGGWGGPAGRAGRPHPRPPRAAGPPP